MVLDVIGITFLMTLFRNKLYHPNLLLVHLNVNYRNMVWCILHPHIFVDEMSSWMTESWMIFHLVSDSI